MLLKFTVCFIKKGSQLIMLNRNSSPNMGLWNGVGGKLKDGENPLDGVLREVFEETGIQLENVRFSGIVTWIFDQNNRGVVGNIPIFLPKMLGESKCFKFSFVYVNSQMVSYSESTMSSIS